MAETRDLASLYADMLRARLFEEAIASLWRDGAISGEMHLGTGEEAVVAGVMAHVRDGDALALDHRGSAPMLLRGVDPVLIVRELLGRDDGLCRGMGGHMHLFSREHLAASSGIVGAGGPTVAGFALAARMLRPGSVAVAFFGEGSLNQGMMMEALNLASVWKLPALFVCKDDDWSITTPSDGMTAGSVADRVRGFGMTPVDVDGLDVLAVHQAAGEAVEILRTGHGPAFLHARCIHLEAHFMGYPLLRAIRSPASELPGLTAQLARSLFGHGASMQERAKGMKSVVSSLLSTVRDPRQDPENDPVIRARALLDSEQAGTIEESVAEQIGEIVTIALGAAPP